MDDLKLFRKEADDCRTLYDKTQMHYTYMEYILDHIEDVTPYKEEIEKFQKEYMEYESMYEEAIYGQFLRLLKTLMDKII